MTSRIKTFLWATVCFVAGGLSVTTFSHLNAQQAESKAPKWSHGMNLMSRKSTETHFDDKKTQKFGIEVFRDENNGNWIYISETGSIAVVPGR